MKFLKKLLAGGAIALFGLVVSALVLAFGALMMWAIPALVALIIALPLYWLWIWLAPVYVPTLSPTLLAPPFLHVYGLVMLVFLLKRVLLPSFKTVIHKEA